MTDGLDSLVVLDATVLSNFASTDAVDWLLDLLDEPVVVPAVRSELERGRDYGHGFLDAAIESIGADLTLLDPVAGDTGSAINPPLRDQLDAGEAESLLAAIAREGTLATDDLAARRLAAEHEVPVTGSVGLLVAGIRHGTLDEATADRWLERWQARRGYYAPVDRIEEALGESGP